MPKEHPFLLDFDLETIKQLGGGAVFLQVARLLEQAVADCQARPKEKRPRKVSILINVTPKTRDEDGIDEEMTRTIADGLGLEIQCDMKLPNRKSMQFDCGIGPGNKILFNPYNSTNFRQPPLPIIVDQQRDGKEAAAGS